MFFWQRFQCQMSPIHTLLIMAKKKSSWRWWWWWYYITDIYNKKPSFTLTPRKIVLMATPRHQWQMSVVITGSPNAPPVLSPLFLQWLNQRFANISSLDDTSNHWPPLHESAGWLSQRSSIVNQKVYPAFRVHGKRTIFEGRMKNTTKVDKALDVIRLDCLISQSTPTP